MNVKFKKIILHNFGSYGHTEVELVDRGFCLVSGKNNCSKDSALSNGSGKSFLWSGICYALTGETISGLKTNLKNINIDEDSCYVVLDVAVDGDEFSITRTNKPKSDLKIIKNGSDVSGKGIRESEQKLAGLLPELTKDLIASTIIIGQGMPNKFSAFSPSGRKELLEKLTKSDFMIEDIKARIADRLVVLGKQLRENEDSLLVNNTQVQTLTAELTRIQTELSNKQDIDYTSAINAAAIEYAAIDKRVTENFIELTNINNAQETANNNLVAVTAEKASINKEELDTYIAKYNELVQQCSIKNSEVLVLKKEIAAMEAVKDVCPTCGQKLIGVKKPDTSEKQAALAVATAELLKINESIEQAKAAHQNYLAQIDAAFEQRIEAAKTELAAIKTKATEAATAQQQLSVELSAKKAILDKLTFERDNYKKYYDSLVQKCDCLSRTIAEHKRLIDIATMANSDCLLHVETVKKIETLIKRDFRGYLLTNIISFINTKAKEYSNIVFGTADLEVYLDGNALEITYCDKFFDNLSGGEKQRVDLILQFAIRDMLSTYLNYTSNIIVLDEIFDNLDRLATDRILSLITEKLKDIESIYIISHHADSLNIGYDSELTVTKNEEGISTIN